MLSSLQSLHKVASSIVAFLRDQINHAQARGSQRGSDDAENLSVALECISAVFAVTTKHEDASQSLLMNSNLGRSSSSDVLSEDLKNQGTAVKSYFFCSPRKSNPDVLNVNIDVFWP